MLTLISRPALGLALVVLVAWTVQPAPILMRVLPALVALAAIVHPVAGVSALAVLGPISAAIAASAGSGQSSLFLEQLILAAIVGVSLRMWRRREPARLYAPATMLGVVAAASAIAAQPELLVPASPGAAVGDHLRWLLAGGYFARDPPWQPLHAAALVVEGAALSVTIERVLRGFPAAALAALRLLVCATAAIAVLNIGRLIEVGMRTGDVFSAVPDLLLRGRFSRLYDVNAAAFVFLVTLVGGVGAAVERRGWILLSLPLALIALGLWLTGSRAALAALVVVVAAGLVVSLATNRRRSGRWISVGALVVVLIVAAVGVWQYPAERNLDASIALASRRIMAETSIAMWRTAPVLGIGVGRYYAESARFGAEALRDELRMGVVNENAHNNFLQVLAEQGIVGLAALLLVVGSALVAALRAERETSLPMRRWTLLALLAGLITWLSGHPLLVPEAAFTFWFLLGLLAGVSPPSRPGSRHWSTAATATAIVLLAIGSVRAYTARAGLDLDHVGTGVSIWHHDETGERYRDAGSTFALYLPAKGGACLLPVRRAPGAPASLHLSFSVRGQRLNQVVIAGDDWQRIPIAIPSRGWRYELVEFVVSDAEGAAEHPLLQIGRVQ